LSCYLVALWASVTVNFLVPHLAPGSPGASLYVLHERACLTSDDLYRRAEREVPLYVERLRTRGYSLDALLVSTGGFFVDNAPPDTRWCQIIERWNREHEDIRLRTATLGEWFAALPADREYSTYQVAWPDSWAHGLGSCTARVAQVRRSQRRRADISALIAQRPSSKAGAFFEKALEQERMALEHTFGAWSTTRRPTSWMNNFEQNVKELFFHRSELYLNEAVGAALRMGPKLAASRPILYAGSAERADGTYLLHFTSEELHPDPEQQALRAKDGHHYPFQCENAELAQFVARIPLTSATLSSFELVEAPAVQQQPVFQREQSDRFIQAETDAWQVAIDTETGCVSRLYETATGEEWVDERSSYGFGQLVHERVVHRWGWRAVGNQQRFLALGVANEKLKDAYPNVPVFERSVMKVSKSAVMTRGAVFDEVKFSGSASSSSGSMQMAWRLYHDLPLLELVIDWDKSWSDVPEAAYVAFPFAGQSMTLDLETGGGFFRPGSHERGGQLPGTCSSYYTLQRAARVATQNGAKALWLPLDALLVMVNELNFNRREIDPWQWNGFLASMPVNHYWHTNFPTSQRGPFRLRYRFISQHGFASDEQAIAAAMPVEALGWH
jgi:hypothetical protein